MTRKISFVEALPVQCLPIDEYRPWYYAIKQDQASEVEKILKTGKRDILLNGKFLYNKEPELLLKTRNDMRPSFELTKPLCLAVAFNAHKTIGVLYKNGLDIMVTDENGKFISSQILYLFMYVGTSTFSDLLLLGNNVLHILVVMSLLYPEKEESMVLTYKYLQALVDKSTFKELLFSENNQGLRPIEHASNVAAFCMFRVMMETEGNF